MAEDYDSLYMGLQQFREYVESNMPYKTTCYFSELDPTLEGFRANIGALYFRIDATENITDIYYKLNSTDVRAWSLLGSGGGSNPEKLRYVIVPAGTTNIDVRNLDFVVFQPPTVNCDIYLTDPPEMGDKIFLNFLPTIGGENYGASYSIHCLNSTFIQAPNDTTLSVNEGGYAYEFHCITPEPKQWFIKQAKG